MTKVATILFSLAFLAVSGPASLAQTEPVTASTDEQTSIIPEVGMYFGETEETIRQGLAEGGLQLVYFRHEGAYNEVHALREWQRWIMKLDIDSGLVIVIEQE